MKVSKKLILSLLVFAGLMSFIHPTAKAATTTYYVYSTKSLRLTTKAAAKQWYPAVNFKLTTKQAKSDVIIKSVSTRQMFTITGLYGVDGYTDLERARPVIYINPSLMKIDVTPNSSVIAHELGHFLGLDHVKSKKSIMYYGSYKNMHVTNHDKLLVEQLF